jgi:hypothetical protein
VRWVTLDEASHMKQYQMLISDLKRDGMPSEMLARGLAERALRRAIRLGHRLGALEPSPLGPRWPFLGM